MNEISYKNWSSMSDEAIEAEIGRFIKSKRQTPNKNQDELARAANIGLSTLSSKIQIKNKN